MEDVVPFSSLNLFVLFDVPPIWCDIYMKLYPPNKGKDPKVNDCTANPLGPVPSSTETCWAQIH